MTENHALIVPPTGLLEVVHSDVPIDPASVEATLRLRAEGVLATLHHANCVASWLYDEHGSLNPRARVAFQMMTGANMMFMGPVVFTGADEHLVANVVAALSLPDQVL